MFEYFYSRNQCGKIILIFFVIFCTISQTNILQVFWRTLISIYPSVSFYIDSEVIVRPFHHFAKYSEFVMKMVCNMYSIPILNEAVLGCDNWWCSCSGFGIFFNNRNRNISPFTLSNDGGIGKSYYSSRWNSRIFNNGLILFSN